MSAAKQNVMREPRVAKVVLNFGAGKNQDLLEKGIKLFKSLTTVTPVKCITQARIAAWGLRPGLPVGAKATLRGKEALTLLPRLLYAKEFRLKESCFDNVGNVSFGIPEYIDIKDANYDSTIGIIGLQVSVTLERPGYRVGRRRIRSSVIPATHRISKEESMEFMKHHFKVQVGDE